MIDFFFKYKYIIVPTLVWIGIQLFKVIYKRIDEKVWDFTRFWGAGGMPSSHSAVVCSLAALIGREYGLDSGIFAIALIMACVVMYDAAGIRRAAGKQARILNKILDTPGLTTGEVQERLIEALGHTPVQVFVGAIVGTVVGFIV